MAAYEVFAPFYDMVNGDPDTRSRQILDNIARFRPETASVLELGCGTGAILAGLGSGFSLTGLDLSPEMLAFAKRRCPSAHFLESDMTSFSLEERFDVVLCIFDTVNHLTTFDDWRRLFKRAKEHLLEGGLFIFDLNTLGRLRQLGEMAPWVHHFDEHTLIMNVEFDGHALSQWDIRIFEHQYEDRYVLHHERIAELGVALEQVKRSLAPDFDLLEELDPGGFVANDESSRALFVYQRK